MSKKNNSSKSVSLDEVCTLIEQTFAEDDLGQDIPTETTRDVFCTEIPVYSSEHTNARLRGIKPAIALVIYKDEYNKETLLCYQKQKYEIYRLYLRSDELLELYCEVRVGAN